MSLTNEQKKQAELLSNPVLRSQLSRYFGLWTDHPQKSMPIALFKDEKEAERYKASNPMIGPFQMWGPARLSEWLETYEGDFYDG